MSLLLYILVIGFWIGVAALDYAEFCYVWQLKEYRLDRFMDFISTRQGKNFLKSYLVSGRLIVLGLLVVMYFSEIGKVSILLVGVLLVMEIFRYAYKIFKNQLRRPKITSKVILIILTVFIVELSLWFLPTANILAVLIIGLRFFLLSLIVAIFYLPTRMIKLMFIFLATRKLKKFPNLKVIGVTGSYGKTTVKVFLDQILSAKFDIAATPKNINTEIGIAKFILQNDFSGKNIFVVEMGAYNVGEIKMICDMVHPEIGILTAINEQHLSLFGSMENIQKAKAELLLSLPKKGLAIVNADNKYCQELLPTIKSQIKTFGTEKENKVDCLISDVKIGIEGVVSFSLEVDGEHHSMRGPLVGGHNTSNVAVCVLAAHYLGMDITEVAKQVEKLKLPDGTLQTHKYGQSVVIDDSYNANPEGFRAALEILKAYPTDFKKIVITRGMIELGERSSQLHTEIGAKIAEVADELVIIANNNEKELSGNPIGRKIEIFSIYDADALLKYVQKFKNSKYVALLENRLPAVVHKELTEI